MVYTELAPRQQQFHVAQAMQHQPITEHITSVDIKNTRINRIQSLIQNHMQHVRSESARKQRITLSKSDE